MALAQGSRATTPARWWLVENTQTHNRSQEWESLCTRTCPSLALQLPVTLTPFSLLILCVVHAQQNLAGHIKLNSMYKGHRPGMRTLMIKQHYVNVTTKSSTKQISANEFVAINYYYYDGK